MKKKSDRQQTSDDWTEMVQERVKFKIKPEKKQGTYRVVKTVEYSMLLDGSSVKEVSQNYRVGSLDCYWTRKDIKQTITKLKEGEKC